jgi:hypothetical protein
MEHLIMLKTTFSDWQIISKEEALNYAKWKFKNITTQRNDEELIAMVNSHYRGIEFTVNELK